MDIYLFNVTDSVNTINKTKKDKIHYDIKFKGDGDVVKPVIYLEVDKLPMYNYAYIPEFKRYYFITDITMTNNRRVRLLLDCDVLESFKDDIFKSKCSIERVENGNDFIDDGNYLNEVTLEVDKFESDRSITMKEQVIINVYRGDKDEN